MGAHRCSPKDRRQLHRWLIGIDEEGIFINPALLARAEAVVATPHPTG
jgi:hypothetical protein